MPQVFVYGSLKRHQPNRPEFNRGLLTREGAVFLKDLVLKLPLQMFNMGYFPALVPAPLEEHTITGELYEITDELLAVLDRIEGHPDHYRRVQYPAHLGEAWVYVRPELNANYQYEIIPEGVW